MTVNSPTENNTEESAEGQNEISITEYLGILLEGWPWILGFALLGLVVGIYNAWSQPPIFQAKSLIRIEQQNSRPQESLLLASEFGSKSSVSAESVVLKSRSVLGAAVDRLNLQIQATPIHWRGIGRVYSNWQHGSEPASPPLGLLPSYAWGGERIKVTRLTLSANENVASFLLIAGEGDSYLLTNLDGEQILTGRIGSSASGNYGAEKVVTIRVDELSARAGTKFNVRQVARDSVIGAMAGRISVSEEGRNSGILKLSMLGESTKAAERQLNAIMDVYLEDNVEKQSEEASNRLVFLKEQLPEIKQQRDSAEERFRRFQESAGLLDLDAEAQSLLERLTEIDQALEEASFERETLLRTYTEKHVSVESVDSRIARLRNKRSQYARDVKKLPQSQSDLLELRRDVEVSNKLYLQLLNQAQEFEIARAGITGFVHVVDKAYGPSGKIGPDRFKILSIHMLVGLVLGAILVVLKDLLKSSIREPDELEEKTGLPVYASIPFSRNEKNRNEQGQQTLPLAIQDGEDLAVESMRSFRTSMQFALMESENSCIAFTGPTPSCGKSFVSMNVAILLAQTGKSVVLVDADLRRGRLRKSFNISKGHPGLSECLLDENSIEDAAVGVHGLPLDVISAGTYPPNPSEMLMSPKLQTVLRQLNQKYDYVILDLPPVLNVSDASIVAHLADAVFMVVRSEQSTLHDVQQARKRLNRDDVKLKGLLFNGFKPSLLRYGYSKYGYYTYRYTKAQ